MCAYLDGEGGLAYASVAEDDEFVLCLGHVESGLSDSPGWSKMENEKQAPIDILWLSGH